MYIGQAFLPSGAIVPVSVRNGQCSVRAAFNDVRETALYNKVIQQKSDFGYYKKMVALNLNQCQMTCY